MWLNLKRLVVHVLVVSLAGVGTLQPAQAALIGTEQAIAAAAGQHYRARASALLDRPEIQARLQDFGVSLEEAQARVAALTDAEAAALADGLDSLPAGGEGVIGSLIFVFLVLLVTDILGFTKVFPFTRSVKR